MTTPATSFPYAEQRFLALENKLQISTARMDSMCNNLHQTSTLLDCLQLIVILQRQNLYVYW
jgi:hypothetical protein